MQEEKRLNRLARSHQCSVETHDKPALVLHSANTIARAQQVWKSYTASTEQHVRLPPCKHRKAWIWDPLKLRRTKQATRKDLPTPQMMFETVQSETLGPSQPLSLSGAAQYRKTFCLCRTNMWAQLCMLKWVYLIALNFNRKRNLETNLL